MSRALFYTTEKIMNDIALIDEETISRISDVCPRAVSSYFIALYRCSQGECCIYRDEIINQHRSWTKFKNDLRALSRLFILNFFDDGDKVSICLVEDQ